jgi:hypothetical protein
VGDPWRYQESIVCQLAVMNLGHEQPTMLLTNDERATFAGLIAPYAKQCEGRMRNRFFPSIR